MSTLLDEKESLEDKLDTANRIVQTHHGTYTILPELFPYH